MPESTNLPPHKDPAQWDALIEAIGSPAILVVIASQLGDRLKRAITAEDVLQETLAMAWRDRDQHEWNGYRPYRGWLLGIARNVIHNAADWYAAKKRGGEEQVDTFSFLTGSEGGLSSILPAGSTTPSRIAAALEEAAMMQEVLDELPKDLRDVVHLRLFEDLTMREVAERLGIGLTTAKERLFRGSSIYRTKLEPRLRVRSTDEQEKDG